jgi:hypothetical protein
LPPFPLKKSGEVVVSAKKRKKNLFIRVLELVDRINLRFIDIIS